MLSVLERTGFQKEIFDLEDMNKDKPVDLLCMRGYNVQKNREVEGKSVSYRFSILQRILKAKEIRTSKHFAFLHISLVDCNLRASDYRNRNNPLHWACFHMDVDSVTILSQKFPQLSTFFRLKVIKC
jgi:hypothetical protein